jgi:rod shape-determining protein MreD
MLHVEHPIVRVMKDIDDPILTCAESHLRPVPGGAVISYVSPLLAVIVGIFHAALAPVIVIGGVKPNLVLVAVVMVTCLAGFLPGITWAFVAGLTANLLVGDPLGSIPLSMLLVAVVVAGGSRVMGRLVWVFPVLATFVGSLVADLVSLGLNQLVGDVVITRLPFDLLLGAATLNAAVAALVMLPARMVVGRYAPDEAGAW